MVRPIISAVAAMDSTNGQVVCPHCGGAERCSYLNPANGVSRKTRTGSRSQRRVWKCGDCRKQFSVLTGTIFHGSKVSVRTWLFVIFEMCASKNGVSAREIERKYDLTAKTAWFMLHRIREAMKREPLAGLLSGTVIADETWVRGTPSNRHGYKPVKGRITDKTPFLSLVHYETRELRSRVIPRVDAATLRSAIAETLMAYGRCCTRTLRDHTRWSPRTCAGTNRSIMRSVNTSATA
jgi:transposase-like protein